MLQAVGPAEQSFAALFDYACHSRSLRSSNRLVSGDILGIAAQEVERSRAGLIVGAVAGASGDIDPVSVVDGFERDGAAPSETVRLGRRLGQDVLDAMKGSGPVASTGRVHTSTARILLPPKHQTPPKAVTACVQAIDDVALVCLDCEASVEIGLAIKASSPFAATFVITNCNGWTGYLPVAHQYLEGGYEVEHTGFGPAAAALLVERVTAMLRTAR